MTFPFGYSLHALQNCRFHIVLFCFFTWMRAHTVLCSHSFFRTFDIMSFGEQSVLIGSDKKDFCTYATI